MASNFGARKDGAYMIVCTMPDVCKIPNQTPVPFPITKALSAATKTAKKTKFNSKLVVMLKSNTPTVLGDQAGVAKGVKSGSVGKKAEPINHSKKVKVESSWLIRVGDAFDMNNGNTKGKLVFAPAPMIGTITDEGEINE